MKSAIIRLGLKCNHQCLFCTVASGSDKPIIDIKAKIDILTKKNIELLNITGGEPTIIHTITDIISYAKTKGIKRICLQTNGSKLHNLAYAKKLKQSGLDSLLIALHSHDEKTSNYLTGSRDFKNTVKGIKICSDLKMEIIISHVINKKNYKNLTRFCSYIKDLSSKIQIYFALVRPNGRTKDHMDLVPKLTEIELPLHNALNYCRSNNITVNSIEGIPLCYLQDYEDLSAETLRAKASPQTYVNQNLIEDYNTIIHHNLKQKAKDCALCKFNDQCVGVWKEYAQYYGLDELYPIF